MHFTQTKLKGSYIIETTPFRDDRGLFERYYCRKEFKTIGFEKEFVQFNHSVNKQKGTIRGLHYQRPPGCEVKFIKCIKGAVFDVFVDLRAGSHTFLQHFCIELSAANMNAVLIPEGFAHGFQTLEDDSELIYHHTAYYNPAVEAGLRFDDPVLKINWPLPVNIVSEKDLNYTLINNQFKEIEL